MTSAPTALYQGDERPNDIYYLTSKEQKIGYQRLKMPNLVTGFGASAFSYCVYKKQDCELFIEYIDYTPIDSMSAGPFINLLDQIQIGKMQPFITKTSVASHNLYM